MIGTLFLKIRLNHIKKTKSENEYEKAVHDLVLSGLSICLKLLELR